MKIGCKNARSTERESQLQSTFWGTHLPEADDNWMVWIVLSFISCVLLPVVDVYVLQATHQKLERTQPNKILSAEMLISLQAIWVLTPSLPGEITCICRENISQNRVVHYNPSTFHIICPTMVIYCMLVDNSILRPSMYHPVGRKL